MVKYFIKNTEKEIKDGDTIEISLFKEFPKGFKEHRVFTLTFHAATSIEEVPATDDVYLE